MRRIVAGLFITLDGVVESPEMWHERYADAELDEVVRATAARSDAILLGRRTYEELAEFWPYENGGTPFADYMNGTTKHVVSTTLGALAWDNSNLITGNVRRELEKLKLQPGREIQIIGSPTLVQSLLRDGLLDELGLLVHPIVVGGGRRLFENGGFGTALELVGSRSLRTGVLSLTYAPAVPR